MVCNEAKNKKIRGKTITLKIKTNKFDVKTRAHSFDYYTNDYNIISNNCINLLKNELPIILRLLGIRLSSLEQKEPQNKTQKQLDIFFNKNNNNNNKRQLNNNEIINNERPKKKHKKNQETIPLLFKNYKMKKKEKNSSLINKIEIPEIQKCPLCNLGFKSNFILNKHLDECLNKNETNVNMKKKKKHINSLTNYFKIAK